MIGERTLAAIVFTDVQGFTARASDNEELAYRLLEQDFDVMRQSTIVRSGRVLKTMGDGMLMAFATASDAVDCALDIQRQFEGRPKEALLHRIGVHLGDLLLTENDAHGDGVNVASRLQAEASPGGVVLSQTVYDIVRGRLQIQVHDLGERQLKNLPQPVRLFELLPSNAPRIPRVAVASSAPSGMPAAMFFLGCCILVAVAAFWFRDSAPGSLRDAQAQLGQPATLTRGDVQRLLALNAERKNSGLEASAPVSDVPETGSSESLSIVPKAPTRTPEQPTTLFTAPAKTDGKLKTSVKVPTPAPAAKPKGNETPKPPVTDPKQVFVNSGDFPAMSGLSPEEIEEMRKQFEATPELKEVGPKLEAALRMAKIGVGNGINEGFEQLKQGGLAYEIARQEHREGYKFDAMLTWLEDFDEWHGSPLYTRAVNHWSTLAEFMSHVQQDLEERKGRPITIKVPSKSLSGTITPIRSGVVMINLGSRSHQEELSHLDPHLMRALASALFSEDGLTADDQRMLAAFDTEYMRGGNKTTVFRRFGNREKAGSKPEGNN